jgi:hypothetical protein
MSNSACRSASRVLAVAAFCAWAVPFDADAAQKAIPDFSGLWARTTFGYDLAASGPGPLKNLARRANGTSDAFKLVGDYHNPILTPGAAAVVKQHGEISLAGKSYPDLSNECRPLPPPYILRIAQMQMLQEKGRITILYIQDHQFREVRLNASHPAHVTPSWHGDSVGHYEGDTLVIDTIGIKTKLGATIDMYGTPYTEHLHVIERYRLVSAETAEEAQRRSEKEYGRPTTEPVYVDFEYKGKGLQVKFNVEDDGAFITPWSSSVTYRRSSAQWGEIVCSENTTEFYPGATITVPRADKPDF